MVGQQTGNLMAKRQRKDEARAETARLLLRLAAVASVLLPLPLQAASSATHAGLLDAPTLLMLGINVGVIAFAIATAIGCLRATERAKEASERAALEAAGQTLLTIYNGTSFSLGYFLTGLALLLVSMVMLRSAMFTRLTGLAGVAAGVTGLIPASMGTLGLMVSVVSLIPLIVWLFLVGRRFLQLGRA